MSVYVRNLFCSAALGVMALVAGTAAVAADDASALADAAKEKGAVVAKSGMVFLAVKEGTGDKPVAADKVKVHYRGTLVDGKEFDSSFKRNAPAEFPLSGVIPCWTEGVQMMKVGGKAKLTCPGKLAYGERGYPGLIPGNATLTFDVELLGINGK